MKPPPLERRFLYITASLIVAGLGLMLLILALPAAAAQPAQPAVVQNAVLFMKAPSEEIAVGDEITVTVHISDVANLYGMEFTLNFTSTELQVVDADPDEDGVQITPADCPKPNYIASNVVSNTVGTIEYAVTQVFPTPPFSGDCAVAYIRFKTLEVTTAQVHFAEWLLSDDDFHKIPADTVDLLLEIKESDFYTYLPTVIK